MKTNSLNVSVRAELEEISCELNSFHQAVGNADSSPEHLRIQHLNWNRSFEE